MFPFYLAKENISYMFPFCNAFSNLFFFFSKNNFFKVFIYFPWYNFLEQPSFQKAKEYLYKTLKRTLLHVIIAAQQSFISFKIRSQTVSTCNWSFVILGEK